MYILKHKHTNVCPNAKMKTSKSRQIRELQSGKSDRLLRKGNNICLSSNVPVNTEYTK